MAVLTPYVEQRGAGLWRAACALTAGDADRAERLLEDALARVWRRPVARSADHAELERVVRDALVATYDARARRRSRCPRVADPVGTVATALAEPAPPQLAPPDLAAVARRARRRARVVRGTRSLAAVAVFAGLAVAVPLAPGWVEEQRPAGPSLAVVDVSTDCRPRTAQRLDHGDFLLGEAAWARFCGVGRSYPVDIAAALVPDIAVTEDVAELVEGWQEVLPSRGPCRPTPSATKFAVQVGFDDGTVTEVYGQTSGCPSFLRPAAGYRVVPGGQVYRELMAAIARQESPAAQAPTAGPTCPEEAPDVPGPRTRQPSTGLAATAVAAAVLCTYDGRTSDPRTSGPAQAELRPSEAERIRVLTLGAFDPDPPRCEVDGAAPTYVALLAGHDGTTYEVTLSGPRCGAVALDGARLGASPALAKALAGLASASGPAAGTVTER